MSDLEALFNSKFDEAKRPGNFGDIKFDEMDKNLSYHYHEQAAIKNYDSPDVPGYAFPALMEMDIAMNNHFYNRSSGLSHAKRAL